MNDKSVYRGAPDSPNLSALMIDMINKNIRMMPHLPVPPKPEVTAQLIEHGKSVYLQNCAACHGADGRGHSPMGKALHVKDLASDDVQKQSDEALEKIIVDGKGKMAGFKGKLSESDVDALVKFIRSRAPQK